MKDKQPKQAHSESANPDSDLDVAAITERIWQGLQGRVNRSTIQQVLLEILPEYENARIRRYVPILMRRKAMERLRVALSEDSAADQAHVPGKPTAKLEPGERADKPAYGLKTGIILPRSG